MKKLLSVYVHIPFCIKKCSYCDFLSFAGMESRFCAYVEALLQEIESKSAALSDYEVQTVFFGGGTPTVLSAGQIGQIVHALRRHFSIASASEWSIEANPKTVDSAYLYALYALGFNRISFGLQSNHSRLLNTLGRIHDYDSFERNFYEARNAGFKNINFDLMFALPGQTFLQWQDTLKNAVELAPEHLSCYGLILEEGTQMHREVSAGRLSLPSEDEYLEMFHFTREFLTSAGYPPYEISNYAMPGYECRHNMVYWGCDSYVGFGVGASSYLASYRYRNENALGEYIKTAGCTRFDVEKIEGDEAVSEYMFMGLRMSRGVSQADFERRFGKSLAFYYEEILEKLFAQGLIRQQDSRIFLTRQGVDISNYVFSCFLL